MKAKLKVKEIEHLYTYNILDISKLRVFCFFSFLLIIIIDPRSKESLLNYSFSFSSDVFLIFQFSHEL